MFKRVCIVLTALLVVGTTFVACKKEAKKEEPAVAVAQDQAAAAQAEAAGQAEADAQLQAAAAQ
ncbi:MAG: hypothetical protein FWC40_07925, partial [Proteobacteria bacterium]|nr:hypothetical protein [Pseudomonadota bacterium]